MRRRDLLSSVALIAGGSLFYPSGLYSRRSRTMTWIVRGTKVVGRRLPVIGAGIIISEVLLGLGRAYGIDIAGEIEERVKRWRGNSRIVHAPAESYRVTEIEAEEAASFASPGRCPDGSRCTFGFNGLILAPGAGLEQEIQIPGPSLWAALRDNNAGAACLHDQPCGLPQAEVISRDKHSGRRIWQQDFANGSVNLEIPRDRYRLEDIYEFNRYREVFKTG